MTRRSRAREVVLQVLYRIDLNPERDAVRDDEFIRRRLLHQDELVKFAQSLLQGVLRNRSELDAMLTASAENWTLDRMAVTDRNVLRLGAYEILFTEVPRSAAINEAVELARRFGSAHSSQFVNGVLDRFMKKDGSDQPGEGPTGSGVS